MTFNFGNTYTMSPIGFAVGAFCIAVGWYIGVTACRWVDQKIIHRNKEGQ
jgi:hypothetical protein